MFSRPVLLADQLSYPVTMATSIAIWHFGISLIGFWLWSRLRLGWLQPLDNSISYLDTGHLISKAVVLTNTLCSLDHCQLH